MKKGIALMLVLLLLCLTGCVEKTPEVPAVSETSTGPLLPENAVPPDEMPSAPEADIGIPEPPQPSVSTE